MTYNVFGGTLKILLNFNCEELCSNNCIVKRPRTLIGSTFCYSAGSRTQKGDARPTAEMASTVIVHTTYIHWLPVNHRISYKLSLLTWKALHAAEPSYLSELISPYAPTRTLRFANTGLLALPTGVTSHFSSRSFSVSSPSVWNSLPAHVRSIDNLSTFKRHLKSHLFQSTSLPSHSVLAPLIRFSRFWRFINLVVCMYVCWVHVDLHQATHVYNQHWL